MSTVQERLAQHESVGCCDWTQYPLLDRAQFFAKVAHEGQERTNGTPYIEHPERVADLLHTYGARFVSAELLAVAYLHDTVEDCGVSLEEIERYFGDWVARGVGQLTNQIEGEEHERAHGKPKWTIKHASLVEHCRHMDLPYKWVKLADRLDNLRDSRTQWKPKRLKRYAKAAYELLQALMPYPEGSEYLAADLLKLIYEIIPASEIAAYPILDDVRE